MPARSTPLWSVPPLATLLGGITPQRFLREYWHKKPLLVRQAVPGLDRVLDREGLFELAGEMDAESRLVRSMRGNWSLEHGPFAADRLSRLPKRNWSLLVQGVDTWLQEGEALLHAFNFVPYARLDDLMVSFAPPGGGVGPHFDSYDVFLIQGLGRRRWEISGQADLELIEDCPLRILRRFEPEAAWELEPGDMLYLPPRYAHNGVALSDCMTWSIGFRAPATQEIASQFLNYLQDRLSLDGRYADPDLEFSRHPAEIPAPMVRSLKAMIQTLRWDDAMLEDFIGRYLSEPKPSVFFDSPARAPGLSRFFERAGRRGLRLDARTRMLYRGEVFFVNGEVHTPVDPVVFRSLKVLADQRALPPGELAPALASLLYAWFLSGYIYIA